MQDSVDDKNMIARYPGESFQDLLDVESVPVPDPLREDTAPFLGSEDLNVSRWTSREFFDQEVEKVWRKTWQMVCRESQLSTAGDYFEYEIVNDSILLTRTEDGTLKGYYNSCLHRGRALKRGSGRGASELRCPFHGWSWSLAGEFKGATCPWDFDHVKAEDFSLPEVQVEVWGGWVFINMDENAEDFQKYLGILPEHFREWKHEQRSVSLHVEKVIGANWKVVLEAFIESYHAIAIHPQLMPFQAIDNSQYDVWGDHVSRTITAYGVPNPGDASRFSEQDSLDGMMELVGSEDKPQLAQGQTAREKLAEMSLPGVSEQVGVDLAERATMSELMDSNLYLLFPNFAPWAGLGPVITYRHRPNGDDVDSCIMDIFILTRYPEGEAAPEDAPTRRLGIDQPFSDAADVMGAGLARVFDQDGANLPQVQKGLKASKKGKVTLGNYQEVRIRHFHQTIDKYLAR
jgi:phenylpropionate dioxygenase-like ring-hydroxylating dioxygenase large terminal subunit